MKTIYLLGTAGGIGLGIILVCMLIKLGMFPTTEGNSLYAVLYCAAVLTLGTAIGAGTYHKRHRG